MTNIIEQTGPRKAVFSVDAKAQFMLAALRRASSNLRADAQQLDEIGVSLKYNMISPEFAVSWLDNIGALDLINSPPWTNRVETA